MWRQNPTGIIKRYVKYKKSTNKFNSVAVCGPEITILDDQDEWGHHCFTLRKTKQKINEWKKKE